MELFMREHSSALKNFNTAYSLVIEYCRSKLHRPEDITAFLNGVRWVCDVIAFKISWILVSKDDKEEADEYMAGHVAWFAQSHSTQAELCRWKCKIYSAMSKLLAAAAQTSVNQSENDQRHVGYYDYLAAKHGIALEQLYQQSPRPFVERILSILRTAYDAYQKRGSNRMNIQIGRLIASQYLRIGEYEQAFQ
jgi:hypothetical protein